MNLNGLLTLWALLIAVYSILPRARRLEIQVKLGVFDWSVLVVAFLLVHYLQFYGFFSSVGVSPTWGLSRWSITPGNASYTVVLFVSVWLLVQIQRPRLPRSNIKKLKRLIEELCNQDQWAVALDFMARHVVVLSNIALGRSPIHRINAYLKRAAAPYPIDFPERFRGFLRSRYQIPVDDQEQKRPISSRLNHARKWILRWLKRTPARAGCWLLSPYSRAQQAAAEVFQLTFLSRAFAHAVVRIRPYLGLRLMSVDVYERKRFVDHYLRELISDHTSVLFSEIRNNQNFANSEGHRYRLPTNNRLLHYLFSDASVAERLGVWKPIGDQVLFELGELHKRVDDDPYNYGMENFQEEACWDSPLYVGVRFFDIMVSEAIHQNIGWHMWLFYFAHFTDSICRNYDPREGHADLRDEFPTKYSYVLYDMVSTLRDWIRGVTALPMEQSNTVMRMQNLRHENDNPVKSSIIAVGQCLRTVCMTESIPLQFKHYLIGIVFDLYFKLKDSPQRSGYATVLLESVSESRFSPREDPRFLGTMISGLVENDNIPHDVAGENRVEDAVQHVVRKFAAQCGLPSLQSYVRHTRNGDKLTLFSERGRRYRITVEPGK